MTGVSNSPLPEQACAFSTITAKFSVIPACEPESPWNLSVNKVK
jgi:hypothetical protein